MKVVKYFGVWCGPCTMLSKTIDGMENKPEIEEVDVDVGPVRHAIRGVPTMVMVDENDQEIKRLVGMATKEQLEKFFAS